MTEKTIKVGTKIYAPVYGRVVTVTKVEARYNDIYERAVVDVTFDNGKEISIWSDKQWRGWLNAIVE